MSVTTRPMDRQTNKPKLRLGNQKLAFFLSTELIKYCELRVSGRKWVAVEVDKKGVWVVSECPFKYTVHVVYNQQPKDTGRATCKRTMVQRPASHLSPGHQICRSFPGPWKMMVDMKMMCTTC